MEQSRIQSFSSNENELHHSLTTVLLQMINTSELTEQWQQMLDCSQVNFIKGQISKLLVFDIIIGGRSKSTFNV